MGTALVVLLEAFAPVIAEALRRLLAGDPRPLDGLLTEHVLQTLPTPLASRLALEAAKAQDAARQRGAAP